MAKQYSERIAYILCLFLSLMVVGLLVHIQTLTGRIATLETQSSIKEEQLVSYERSLCSNDFSLTQANNAKTYTMQVNGEQRSYTIHTPDTYDASQRYPVIFSFDGIEGSGSRMRSYSHLDALPAIIVYPDALVGTKGYTAWQGAPYSVEGGRDVEFVRKLLDTIPSQYCVDATQLFAVGMSNGGSFATIVGCELGNQIRAVASVSGAFYTTCEREERTPSLLVVHSMNDGQVPYLGEVARKLPKVQQWVNDQAAKRHCTTTLPVRATGSVVYYNWLDCSDNSMLRFAVVKDQPHGWLRLPSTSRDGVTTTAEYVWKFFEESRYNDAR